MTKDSPGAYSTPVALTTFFILVANSTAFSNFPFFLISNPMCGSHPLFALNGDTLVLSDTVVLVCTLLLYANSAVASQSGHCSCL